jgi:8-oxo-dGTP diphosphatase
VSPRTLQAAGGVLWRGDPVDPLVAVVHRPAYDDWSLPKGKAKQGEHLLVTAIREVEEETGHRPRIGPYLTTVRYRVFSGRRLANKVVTYWSMRCLGGTFEPNREVDALEWLRLDAARRRLSSARDRTVLDAFAHHNRDTEPLLLLRHGATAAPARRLKTPPTARQLTRTGREQAAALVPVFANLGVTDLLSADLPACAEMLAPYAEAAAIPVRREALLTRLGFEGNERDVADRVRRHAASGQLAVCGPNRVITGLLHALGAGSPTRPPHEAEVRKGGWWLLHHRAGAITAYERHELS